MEINPLYLVILVLFCLCVYPLIAAFFTGIYNLLRLIFGKRAGHIDLRDSTRKERKKRGLK